MSFITEFGRLKSRLKQYDLFKAMNFDISMHEYMTLCNINDISLQKNGAPVWVSDLVEESEVSAQAISKCLRSIESKGYIERFVNPEDRRVTGIRMCDKGREIFETVTMTMDNLIEKIFYKFSEDEYNEFVRLMDKFEDSYAECVSELAGGGEI